MTLVECKESLKGIANFIALDACFGDNDLLQVQRLANKLLAMQTTSVMNRKQKEIKNFFPEVDIYAKHGRSVLRAMFPEKYVVSLFSIFRLC